MHKFLINDFEGPLDLLLHLVKQSKMDIYDIDIVKITAQYVEFIKSMEEMNLDIASEYLLMAAELIEMKSIHLLPKKDVSDDLDDYVENSEEELKRRLIEYKAYKESVQRFKDLENTRHEVFTKSPERISEFSDKKLVNEDGVSIFELLKALENVMERVSYSKPMVSKVAKKEFSVRERIVIIRDILNKKKKIKFEELFEEFNKDYIIVTFLSILTMANDNEIKVIQDNNFGDIYLEKVG